MRGGIIITLIVVGGALVAAPLIVEFLMRSSHEANTARLLERPGASSVNLYREEIPNGAEIGCWVVGAGLAGIGVYLAVRELNVVPVARPREPVPT